MVIKNIRLTHSGVSKQEAWEGFRGIASHKGLYNGLNITYGVYNFEGSVVNPSGVYGFPAKTLEYMR